MKKEMTGSIPTITHKRCNVERLNQTEVEGEIFKMNGMTEVQEQHYEYA